MGPRAFQMCCAAPWARARAHREVPAPRAVAVLRNAARGHQRTTARLASLSARPGLFPPEPSLVPAWGRLALVRSVSVRLAPARLPSVRSPGARPPGPPPELRREAAQARTG